jgi:hypothetical protein
VGYYDGDKMIYVAKVRNGFVPHTRRAVASRFAGLKSDTCPFPDLPEKKRTQWVLTEDEMKNCRWLKPELVVVIVQGFKSSKVQSPPDPHLELQGDRVREMDRLHAVVRREGSLSLAAAEEYIRRYLQFILHEERQHPIPDTFAYGLSSRGGESCKQLAVASTTGFEWLPVRTLSNIVRGALFQP